MLQVMDLYNCNNIDLENQVDIYSNFSVYAYISKIYIFLSQYLLDLLLTWSYMLN